MRWEYKIELNKAIEQNDEEFDLFRHEEECPVEAKERIAVELEKASPLRRFAEPVRKAKSIAEVIRLLNTIYDTADRFGVWCGL